MAINLKREGIALNAEERNKRNENLTIIEQELEKIGSASALAELAKLAADDAKVKTENVQQQVNALTVSGDSSPQAAQASIGADGTDYDGNLKARLDAEHNTVTAQLADKANLDYVDTKLQEVANGAPKGTYTTLVELQSALPNGDAGNYLVAQNADGSANGNIHTWSGSAWVSTGILYQAAGIGENSVKPFTTSFLASDNLYIYDKRTPNSTLVDGGALYSVTTHDVTDFIPVTAGLPYSLTKGMRFLHLYDTNKQFVRILESTSYQNAIYTFTPTANGFIRAAILKEHSPKFTMVQAAEPAGIGQSVKFKLPLLEAVDNAALIDESVDHNKTTFLTVGKNLFDKNVVTPNALLNFSTGLIDTLAGYSTSDFIKVKAGVAYTLSNVRVYNFFGLDKQFSHGFNTGSNAARITMTPKHDSFIRVSISNAYLNTFQIEKGQTATEYESYRMTMPSLSLSEAQLKGNEETVSDVSVTKTGEFFFLESVMENGEPITINTVRNGSANQSFNFLETKVNGATIHAVNDDITPIRTFYTVGANHGYGVVQIEQAGFTSADLGSKWTDGVRTFTLVSVAGSSLQLAPEYTVDANGIVSAAAPTPVANLTHVSGATNSTALPITGHTIKQLYPSIKNISVKYLVDGKEISKDGKYSGKELIISESYEVIDYKALIDFYQANIGQSHVNANVDGIVKISNTFIYTKGLKCTTSHSLKSLKKVYLGRCGFLQSIAISLSGYTRKRFMPNVKAKSGFDFSTGVDLDAFATSLVFSAADYKDPAKPPSHYVDWLYNASGAKTYGFTMGYIVDKSNSKNADRIANSPNAWDMRSTKKSYPVAIEGITLEAGKHLNFMGFRNYMAAQEVGKATNLNVVKDHVDTYLYADFNESVTGINKPLNNSIGKAITPVQANGIVLLNDVADSEGVVLSSTNPISNGIYKVR